MIKSLGGAARERLETGAQHEKLYEALRTAQAGFVKAAAPAMVDAQTQLSSIFGAANFNQDEATKAREDRRADQRHHRRRQSDGVQHDGRAVVQQQRHARNHREANPRRTAAPEIEPRSAAEGFADDGAAATPPRPCWRWAKARPASSRSARRNWMPTDYGQTILEETRKLNVGLGISVQQLVDGVRKETDASTLQAGKEISLATMVMLGARRGDPDRLDPVRLALCRPQHPAPHPQPAAFDAAAVRAAISNRRSINPARRTRSRRWRTRCTCSARA